MKKITLAISTLILLLPAKSSFSSMEDVEVFTVQQPTLGPVLGAPDTHSRRVWARGPVTLSPNNDTEYHLALSLRPIESDQWPQTKLSKMFIAYNENGAKNRSDYTGFIDLDNIEPGRYIYRCGYIETSLDTKGAYQIDWPQDTPEYRITVRGDTVKDTSIIFGSCRYFAKVFCFYLWLNSSDETYTSITHQIESEGRDVDAFVTLGDFVYADSLRWFNQAHSYRQFMNLYEKAFGTAGFKKMVATTPMFTMLDDHEVSNNFDAEYIANNQDLYNAAMAAYGTYQHMITPGFNKDVNDPRGGYSFKMAGVPAYMLDTRSQRSEGHIIAKEAMSDLKLWLEHYAQSDYKMIFTGVPVFPAYIEDDSENHDKWYGFQNQLKDMLGFIDEHAIHGVIFGSGDIHKSCYSQITTPVNKVILTNIVSSPFYWPYGHDFLHAYRLQIEDKDIKDFIPGYPYITRSEVYPMDGFARLTFNGGDLFDVQLYGKDNAYLNENDAAGHMLSTREFKVNL